MALKAAACPYQVILVHVDHFVLGTVVDLPLDDILNVEDQGIQIRTSRPYFWNDITENSQLHTSFTYGAFGPKLP